MIVKIFKMILIHITNLISNLLGVDPISICLRRYLFIMIGNDLAHNSKIRGGGYIYGNSLVMGEGSTINRNCYIDLTGAVIIGKYVDIGHGVTFITAHHNIGPTTRRASKDIEGKAIHINDGAWIAANVTIQPGVTIGAGAVVLAGAVVTKDVDANCVYSGIPAVKKYQLDL